MEEPCEQDHLSLQEEKSLFSYCSLIDQNNSPRPGKLKGMSEEEKISIPGVPCGIQQYYTVRVSHQ